MNTHDQILRDKFEIPISERATNSNCKYQNSKHLDFDIVSNSGFGFQCFFYFLYALQERCKGFSHFRELGNTGFYPQPFAVGHMG
jgi:hypothetical protein